MVVRKNIIMISASETILCHAELAEASFCSFFTFSFD
jgi:hypothetical protein